MVALCISRHFFLCSVVVPYHWLRPEAPTLWSRYETKNKSDSALIVIEGSKIEITGGHGLVMRVIMFPHLFQP